MILSVILLLQLLSWTADIGTTRVVLVYNGPKGMELAIVEVAKALGGSFKLVTPAPKPVREMTQLPRET